jgi:Holliday junction resolvasome RuvABC endonuclease subunit
MKIYGADLSLSATGIACNAGWTETLKPSAKLRGHDRMAWLRTSIRDLVRTADLIVVEGPSYGNQGAQRQSGHHERAGLWWLVTHDLWSAGIPVAVASPASVKKYATGRGNAGKDDVVREVTRRFDWFTGDNNAADSLILCALGADQFGEPMVAMPQAHRTTLTGVQWPVLAGLACAA